MQKKQFTESRQYGVPPKRILGTAISLVIFFLLTASVVRLAGKYFDLRTRNKELNDSHAELVQKEATLSTTNAYLATSEGTEQSLRERYNYIKPGEEMIVLTPDNTAVSEPEEKTGLAHWWDQLLKGIGFRKD
jgi:cell division protein FtsB